jgi:hypothetical protein
MKNNRQIATVVILIISTFIIGTFCGYKLSIIRNDPAIRAEASKSSTTPPSSASSDQTSGTTTVTETSPSSSEENTTEACFNYLAIGNSITRHGLTDFWWNYAGMAASDREHDYYHIVMKHLEEKYGNVNGEILNLSIWEVQAEDRDGTLPEYLEPFLNPDLDLITIMLGENADNLETYQEDYVAMLKFIHSKAPNARILVVEDFWIVEERNEMEFNACALTGAEYVSLDGIAGNEDYYCGIGTTVYDKYGNEHTVEHEGVAMHPGDAGMAAIAERIIEAIDN